MASAPKLHAQAAGTAELEAVDPEAGEPDGFRLGRFLPYRLSVVTNLVSRGFAERYSAEFGISIPEWRVMAVLGERAPVSSFEICGATAMDKAKVSRAVSAMIDKSLVRKAAHPEDQRLLRLSLTAKGRRVYDAIIPRARELEAELMAGLGETERAQLDTLLEKLHARAEALGSLEPAGDA
jgi:DNA-binding MarR family transcriptional regulator